MAAGSSAVLSSFLLNLIIGLCAFTAFCFLRVRLVARRYYAPRRYANDIEKKPKRLTWGLLDWIKPTLTYEEPRIINEAGLDAAMYLRVLRFGLYLFVPVSFWCLVAMLPVNLTSNEVDRLLEQQAIDSGNNVTTSDNFKFTDFDKYSLSNIPAKSQKMWVHLISLYFVGILTMFLLNKYNRESVLLRLMYLGNQPSGGPSHSVLVTDVPGVQEAVAKTMAADRKEAKAVRAASKASASKASGSKRSHSRSSSEADSHIDIKGHELELAPPPSATPVHQSGPGPVAEANEDQGTDPTDIAVTIKGAADAPPPPAQEPAPGGALPSGSRPRQPSSRKRLDDPHHPGPAHGEGPHSPGSAVQSAPPQPSPAESAPAAPAEPAGEDEYAAQQALQAQRMAAMPYAYALDDPRTNPYQQAKAKLKAGITPPELVRQEFAEVYGPDLSAVNMVFDTTELEPLVAEYNTIHQALDDYLDCLETRLKLRLPEEHKKVLVFGPSMGEWGQKEFGLGKWFKKLDALDFWVRRLKFLRDEITVKREEALRKSAPSAFVTFNTRKAQAVGSTALHHNDVRTWRVQAAPAPFELVWKNTALTLPVRSSRGTGMAVLFWLMTLFFFIPVSFVQGMIEVPKLATIPVLGDIVTAPVVKQLLEGILPGLAMKIFLAIVPMILAAMATFQGATSLSEIDFSVTKRYFLFQVVVVFFMNVIAGSFFNQLKQWLEDPGSVIPILGKSIPMTATFFITYLFTNGLLVKAMAFLRAPGFVIYWILSKISSSPKAAQRLWMIQYTTTGVSAVDHMMALFLGLVMSCMNPIVCPAALAYFIAGYVGETYNNIYVYRRQYDGAGRLWSTIFNQVMVALYIMEIATMAILLIKKFAYALLALPLILGTIGYHYSTLTLYNRPWKVVSLHDASELDQYDAEARRKAAKGRSASAVEEGTPLLPGAMPDPIPPLTAEEKAVIADNYRNPCFKLDMTDLELMESTAADLRPRLDALNAWAKQVKQTAKVTKTKIKTLTDPAAGAPPEEVTKYDTKPELDPPLNPLD
ncbi:hypothetical protein HYH03_007045 [Edaphochlamys debaryana]|uniref:Uncharacterized protein n=1 Tax=Edaphochlamys debaryana TaxID=47281 RepID=A0A836C0D0_9CHLO|nr:hypothetical protein HYH03_007045 [Edaphochlamys debaryana]|eukprot:KAG2494802.1 hypothetical protein HYH03_007045 [Edaphochlamys debaryana]